MNACLTPSPKTSLPKADQWLGPEGARLLVELPGVSRAGLTLEITPGRLALTGRVRRRPPGGAQEEYPIGDFYRVFTLSPLLNTAQAQAQFEDGVLEVRLPPKGDTASCLA